jgi:C-terminal processing protease CtpA/Prc
VIDLDQGSDAEQKGLRLGDRLLTVDGTAITRENFMAASYALNVALPRRQLELKVQKDDEPPRSITVVAHIEQRRKSIDIEEWFDEIMDRMRRSPRYAWRTWTFEKEGVVVSKLHTFMVTDELMNDLMSKVHNARALILDLRGNPGGSIEALQIAAGAFFEQEIEIASLKERKSTKVLRSRRPRSKRLFTGTLVVLVDSASASSAEVLARVVQLEKRGTVVGDRTAGAVMLAQHLSLSAGNEIRFILYGASVTVADLLMKDGQSLEGVGVTPDEIVNPAAADIREGRDPAMSRAAKLAGLELSPEAAWSHFRPKSEPDPKSTPGAGTPPRP